MGVHLNLEPGKRPRETLMLERWLPQTRAYAKVQCVRVNRKFHAKGFLSRFIEQVSDGTCDFHIPAVKWNTSYCSYILKHNNIQQQKYYFPVRSFDPTGRGTDSLYEVLRLFCFIRHPVMRGRKKRRDMTCRGSKCFFPPANMNELLILNYPNKRLKKEQLGGRH